jgi:hypothetical protein
LERGVCSWLIYRGCQYDVGIERHRTSIRCGCFEDRPYFSSSSLLAGIFVCENQDLLYFCACHDFYFGFLTSSWSREG